MSVVKYGNGDYHRIGYNNSTYRKVAYGTEPIKTLMYKITESAEVVGNTSSSSYYTPAGNFDKSLLSYNNYARINFTNSAATMSMSMISPYSASFGGVYTGRYTQYDSTNTNFPVNGGTFRQTVFTFSSVSGSIKLPIYERTMTRISTTGGAAFTLLAGSFTSRPAVFLSSSTYYSTTSLASTTRASGTKTINVYYTND